MDISFRKSLKPDDRTAIADIVNSTSFFRPHEVQVAISLVDETLEKGADSGYEFIIAEVGSSPIGYTCLGEIPCTKGSYDLYWIVVHKDFQSRGIGGKLLKESENEIAHRDGRKIYVDTSGQKLYEPTVKFYERYGYVLEACLKDYYAEGDDKLIFVKTIHACP